MITRKLFLLLTISLLLASVKASEAFVNMGISTYTAQVSLSGTPNIASIGVTQLPEDTTTYNYYAVISATATCASLYKSNRLTDIHVNYYTDTVVQISTAQIAIVVSTQTYQEYFSTNILVNFTGSPTTFYYRISVTDHSKFTGYWPTNGLYYAVNISSPSMSAYPLLAMQSNPVGYVSAVDGLIVATGTVSDDSGITSVAMYYNTDVNTNYSTYTISVPAGQLSPVKRPSHGNYAVLGAVSKNTKNTIVSTTYNFRFELDKNLVNFAKAKYFNYYLKATDTQGRVTYLPGNHSVYTAQIISANTVNLPASGGNVVLQNGNPDDGVTTVAIPSGAFEGSTPITITQVDPSDASIPPGKSPCATSKPLAVYNLGPEGLTFKKPVTMKLVFQDLAHSGIVDGTNFKTSMLKIFWWDGFDWRLLGGKVDPNQNVVTYNEIGHFSTYALFPVTKMTDNDYRPKERIITPATADGKNDFATFSGLQDGDVVKIYDVTGRKIRELRGGMDLFQWDGRDGSGSMVESGIYIYQIKLAVNSKIISGVIVVAK